MHSIYAHGLEVPSEFHIANSPYDVLEQTLQTATFLYTMSDPRIEGLEAPLSLGYLLFHPGREIKAVVKDFKVRWAGLCKLLQ